MDKGDVENIGEQLCLQKTFIIYTICIQQLPSQCFRFMFCTNTIDENDHLQCWQPCTKRIVVSCFITHSVFARDTLKCQ